VETKEKKLEVLKRAMEQDSSLPLVGHANLVFGEGDPEASVMFIGEAPGFHEDRFMRPFVGQAGKLLDKLFSLIHWTRESVYITNIVKRRPPSNRDPLPDEIYSYKPYLKKQIDIIQPNLIVTLGRFAMSYFVPTAKISRDHGNIIFTKTHRIYPLYHPAAAFRSAQVHNDLTNDFKKLPEILFVEPKETPIIKTESVDNKIYKVQKLLF
jgi:uracil-DNA glycosylase